ncbi:hypothetical protein AK830_g5971 [Neonectria ditissima]|uniref:Uncharacterized protein n=1 Tax=Neonectria ditissima TaxID=78410 RepID=A0A0P7B2K8_9HYPO|nr:hypothetical protein AK830_g5971 [Neonectria ditissima]
MCSLVWDKCPVCEHLRYAKTYKCARWRVAAALAEARGCTLPSWEVCVDLSEEKKIAGLIPLGSCPKKECPSKKMAKKTTKKTKKTKKTTT